MARTTALAILVKYQSEQSYLNITLNAYLKESTLSRKDKDLVTTIVYGTIQNKLYLEYQLEPFIKGKRVKPTIKMILLLSVYQLHFLDKVPEYAVVNEAVNLTKQTSPQATNFVNAIIRNVIRQGKRSYEGLTEVEQLSIETSHPLWMVNMFVKQYGLETTKEICIHNNLAPARHARVNTLKTTSQEILENDQWSKGKSNKDAVQYKAGNIALSQEYCNGLVTIQDESSQLVAPFLNPQKNTKVLDMCCAPGSKTTHLSAIMENTGEIIACDLFEHKIELVKQNLQRLGVTNVTCMVQDATLLDTQFEHESFDSILLDAPCSGFGVVKRKPEIKYHDSSAMDTIIPLQRTLLENAYHLLKKGGIMVYSTCTINKKENEKMMESFSKAHPTMHILEEVCILPFTYDSDGFYMCKLEKRED